MAFPPAHFLVGAGVAELIRTAVPLPRWKAWTVAGLLAVSPDLDFGVGLVLGSVSTYHGTFTHSAFAVVVVSLIGALWGSRWAVLAGAGYGSHIVVDLLDDRGRTNVLLGWPLTLNQPDAIARVFPIIQFEQGGGPIEAALSLLAPHIFRQLVHQTAVGALFFLALVLWAVLIRLLDGRAMRSEQPIP